MNWFFFDEMKFHSVSKGEARTRDMQISAHTDLWQQQKQWKCERYKFCIFSWISFGVSCDSFCSSTNCFCCFHCCCCCWRCYQIYVLVPHSIVWIVVQCVQYLFFYLSCFRVRISFVLQFSSTISVDTLSFLSKQKQLKRWKRKCTRMDGRFILGVESKQANELLLKEK